MTNSGRSSPLKQVKKAVWWITLRCNSHCPYCHARQVNDPLLDFPLIETEKWMEAWNRIKEEVIIDITGGEPFIQPQFTELINGLDPSKKVAITTNLTQDLTQFVQKVSPDKCINITASLHPSNKKMKIEYFIGKVLLLINRGFNVNINFVAFPEQMWLIPRYQKLFANFNISSHIDPYNPGPIYPFTPNEKERVFLNHYFKGDRDDYYDNRTHHYLCDAGMNYFVVSPNGEVWPCVGKIYKKKYRIGNIFEEDFHLRNEPIKCETKSCPGCDVDKVTRIELLDQRDLVEHWNGRAKKFGEKGVYLPGTSDSQCKEFNQSTMNSLNSLNFPKGIALDFGCGAGTFTSYLQQRCGKAVGMDVSLEMLKIAKCKFPRLQFILFSPGVFPIKSDSLDFVFTNTVLQHIVDPEGFMQTASEIKRILKPGGTLCIRENTTVSLSPKSHFVARPESFYLEHFPFLKVQKSGIGIHGNKHTIFVGQKEKKKSPH